MKKYFVSLLSLSLLLVVISFVVLWTAPAFFLPVMPLMVLYFAVVTGFMHFTVVKAAYKDPRTFIKTFMGFTVGTLFLHLIVLAAYMFTHLEQAKRFVLCFCICYVIYLVFETVTLAITVKHLKK